MCSCKSSTSIAKAQAQSTASTATAIQAYRINRHASNRCCELVKRDRGFVLLLVINYSVNST